MTSEERLQKFHTDDVSLPRLRYCSDRLKQISLALSVWNLCAFTIKCWLFSQVNVNLAPKWKGILSELDRDSFDVERTINLEITHLDIKAYFLFSWPTFQRVSTSFDKVHSWRQFVGLNDSPEHSCLPTSTEHNFTLSNQFLKVLIKI